MVIATKGDTQKENYEGINLVKFNFMFKNILKNENLNIGQA